MAKKLTKRKGFSFLRSYFDVLNELEKDKDKLEFLLAIINKQFLDEDPKGLNFLVNLCYESQRHQIESSVNGWKKATNDTLGTTPPTPSPTPLGTTPTTPKQEEKEEGEEEEEEKEEVEEKHYRAFAHLKLTISEYDKLYEFWSKKQIDEILDSVENYANNKKYTSLYLTCRKWLTKEYPKGKLNNIVTPRVN